MTGSFGKSHPDSRVLILEVRTTLVLLDFLRKGILVDLFLSLEKNESRRDKMEGKYEVAIILLHRREKNFFQKICSGRSRVS